MHLESSLREPGARENLSISSLRAISSEPDFENCQKPFIENLSKTNKRIENVDRV
jgi:hypothetical protein